MHEKSGKKVKGLHVVVPVKILHYSFLCGGRAEKQSKSHGYLQGFSVFLWEGEK